jgi:hypothetical protein
VPSAEEIARSRLARLPRQPNLVLQGGLRGLSTTIREGDQIIQPGVALWVDATTGAVRNHTLLTAPVDSYDEVEAVTEALVEALETPMITSGGEPALPGRIVVDSPVLAEALRSFLQPLRVKVESAQLLPEFEEVFDRLNSYVGEQHQPFGWDVSPSLVQPLFRAAAAFNRHAPWRYMDDYPPVAVALGKDGPQGNAKTLYGCVLGARAEVFGIAFYFSRAGLVRTMRAADELLGDEAIFDAVRAELLSELEREGVPVDDLPPALLDASAEALLSEQFTPEVPLPLENSLAVYFDPADETEPSYLAWIEERRLPLPASGDIPAFFRTSRGDEVRLPEEREVRAMTLALEATTGFLREHRRRIERLMKSPFLPEDVLSATVRVSGDREIEVTWPGD